jgi:hypothetical protein
MHSKFELSRDTQARHEFAEARGREWRASLAHKHKRRFE